MTDKQENDAFFKEQAANFIKAQELIYKDPANAKEHFNKGVDACIKMSSKGKVRRTHSENQKTLY